MAANSRTRAILKKAAEKGSIHHAYIFCGSDDAERRALARDFAKYILCGEGGCGVCSVCRRIDSGNYTDIRYIEGRKDKQLLTEDIEAIFPFLMRRPYEGERNIVIIAKGDQIVERAQKRLLKILEEPPAGSVIMILAGNTERIDPTILSRCQIFRLEDLNRTYSRETEKYAEKFLRMVTAADDVPFFEKRKLAYNIQAKKDRKLLNDILEIAQSRLRKRVVDGDLRYIDYTAELEKARRKNENGVTVGNILIYLMLRAEDIR